MRLILLGARPSLDTHPDDGAVIVRFQYGPLVKERYLHTLRGIDHIEVMATRMLYTMRTAMNTQTNLGFQPLEVRPKRILYPPYDGAPPLTMWPTRATPFVRPPPQPKGMFSPAEVRAIRADSRRVSRIAADYGVSITSIYNIKNFVTYGHIC